MISIVFHDKKKLRIFRKSGLFIPLIEFLLVAKTGVFKNIQDVCIYIIGFCGAVSYTTLRLIWLGGTTISYVFLF